MKLAYIGTGKIIEDALYAAASVHTIEKAAVYAREHSRKKAETLAEHYRIPEIYTDYEQLLNETSADTVYIGLVNSAHFSYAKEALLHGKNVILEKPLTGFLAEAEELQKLSREKGLCIMEAVTVLHSDMIVQMRKNLSRLGTIRMFTANYSQYSSRYDEYLQGIAAHSFSPEFYGGALYDINVYNVHYCVSLLGAPKSVKYYPNIGYNGIDTSGVLIMEYNGFQAVCSGAKDSDSPGFVCVQGEKGCMRLDGKPNMPVSLKTVITDETGMTSGRDASGAAVRSASEENFTVPQMPHRMTQEFKAFADVIDRKDLQTADAWMTESVMVMKILEEARKSAGIEF